LHYSLKILLWGSVIIALLFSSITAIIRAEDPKAITAFSLEDEAPVPVVDAGHGGLDGGAVGVGGVCESRINLAIARRAEALLRFLGASPVMTRETDELAYPTECNSTHEKKVWDQKRRVELVNGTERAVLISIHQNSYPDPRPSGCQVLYGTVHGSRELGELLQAQLSSALCPENRRVAAPISEKIYLLKQVSCPAVLIECGFLSNGAEAAKLARDDYQTKLAAAICASYFQYVNGDTEDIDERKDEVFLHGVRE